MNDCISRSALLAAYDAAHVGPPGGARKLIEEAPAISGWISSADRLPKGHNPVLVCRVGRRGRVFVEAGYYAGDGRWRIQSTLAQNVPYWMPMPEAPACCLDGGGTD